MVNVNDYSSELPNSDYLEAIFSRQNELIHKYHPLEEKNVGHSLPFADREKPFDLNDPTSQLRLKDFAWRVTEEIAEATECAAAEDQTHFLEELIDALHFLVEMTIYCGIQTYDIRRYMIDWIHEAGSPIPGEDSLKIVFKVNLSHAFDTRQYAFGVVESLGKAMNQLKNKPWKNTHMLTDKERFKALMLEAWLCFIWLLKSAGLDAEKTVIFYLNKNAVNQFRIRSNY